jgi:mono/diheme cytochrome c family protein
MAEKTEGRLHGLLAEFDTPGALIRGAGRMRGAGYTKWDCHSPFPVHGLDAAMGIKRTILPWLVFGGGISGGCMLLLLQWWANAYDWPWLVSGKPFFSIPASVPIAYEGTVLLAGITAFLCVWALNQLPRLYNPLFRNERFAKVTDNGFFLSIEADDPKFSRERTAELLTDAGAVVVEACRLDPDHPRRSLVPKPIRTFIVASTLLAIIPVALLASARSSTTTRPRWHIITDMDDQPKEKSESTSDLFDDRRAMRPPVAGTVAYGDLRADDHFYRGIVPGAPAPAEPAPPVTGPAPAEQTPAEPAAAPSPAATHRWADTFPIADPARGVPGVALDERTMARGRERFGIYCAPCHGLSGRGDGMIAKRATKVANRWTPPVNLQEERIVRLPHGQLFYTIGSGVRNMQGYAAQIPVADRWAIVLYVRALQRSQNATVDDVPAAERAGLRVGADR